MPNKGYRPVDSDHRVWPGLSDASASTSTWLGDDVSIHPTVSPLRNFAASEKTRHCQCSGARLMAAMTSWLSGISSDRNRILASDHISRRGLIRAASTAHGVYIIDNYSSFYVRV